MASFGDMQKQNGAVRVIKENVFFINISLLLNYRTSISLLRTPCFTKTPIHIKSRLLLYHLICIYALQVRGVFAV